VNPKFYSQNPPPDLIETWARNEALFNLYLAQQLPQVRIGAAEVRPAAAGAFEVRVTVTNAGQMPTALEMAKRVKIVRPDTCAIELATGQELVQPPASQARARVTVEIGWLKPGETKSVSWTVKGAGTATVTVGSTRGGVDRREVRIEK
jgi:hypothetical protein